MTADDATATTTSSAVAARTPGWRALLFATFTIGLSNSLIFAVLGDLQDEYGFSDAGLGMITAIGFVVSLVAQLFVAPLADRGHARAVLLSGLGLAVVGTVLFASGSSLAWFLMARAVVGASIGSFMPAARAIAASLATEQAGERLGRMASIELAGFVLGPVVGGILVDPLGISATFLVFGVAALATLIAVARRALPSPPRSTTRHGLSVDLLRLADVRVAVLLALALFIPVGVYDALWDRYLTDRGASNVLVGLSFGLYGLPFVLLATRGGRLAERMGPVRAAVLSILLFAPLVALYGVIAWPWLIIAVSVVEGSVQALAAPAVQLATARAAPTGRGSAAQGLSGATQLAGASATALIAAPLYGSLGSELVFVTVAVLVLVIGALAWWQHQRAGVVSSAAR
jgi:predicted MFS family arabinose efflux permease